MRLRFLFLLLARVCVHSKDKIEAYLVCILDLPLIKICWTLQAVLEIYFINKWFESYTRNSLSTHKIMPN